MVADLPSVPSALIERAWGERRRHGELEPSADRGASAAAAGGAPDRPWASP